MLLTSLPLLALFPSLDGPFPAHSYPSSETAKESSLRQASDAFVSAALFQGTAMIFSSFHLVRAGLGLCLIQTWV